MKLLPHLPSAFCFKEPAPHDMKNAGNRHAQEATLPRDLQSANTNQRHHHSPLWLKKLLPERSKTFMTAHDHEINAVEREVAGIIADALSELDKDTLTTSEFKKLVRNRINHGLNAHDQKFAHDLQYWLPWKAHEQIKRRKHLKESAIHSAREACRRAGWALPLREGSNMEWESPAGPLLIKRGCFLQQLKLNKANIADGAYGSVSIFEDEKGYKLIGKISKNNMPDERGGIEDDLAIELKAYKKIYNAVGPHPNLVNAYGIAKVPHGEEMKRTLLMDAVPGPNGKEAFHALGKCWDNKKITTGQYWGAIQFIGRRLLDVTEHLGKAGVVHNDIKPENFMVNGNTGEPVVIDLGLWSKTGKKATGGTPGFWTPEAKAYKGVDERSDVFTVAASLLNGVEGLEKPNQGHLWHPPATRDEEGNVVRVSGTYSAETAYTWFMNSILKERKDIRVDSRGAKKLAFLSDSMLDDDAAKKVIIDAISLARKEEQKPEKEQWRPANLRFYKSEARDQRAREAIDALLDNPNLRDYMNLRTESRTNPALRKYSGEVAHLRDDITQKAIDALLDNPSLRDYALLQNASKISPELKKILNTDEFIRLRNDLEQETAHSAGQFIAHAPWFYALKRITETVNIKSGVYTNGVRLNPENKNIDPAYESSLIRAKKNLEPHADIGDLRQYAKDAEAFLRDAMALKEINNPEIADQLEQVKERAAVARRMVEIFDTESTKPGNGNVQERAFELERQFEQLKRRK